MPVTTAVLGGLLNAAISRAERQVPEVAHADLEVSDDAIPGLTAIETYGGQAVADYQGSGTLTLLATGVRWAPEGHPASIAWHDRTACVVLFGPGDEPLTIEYEQTEEDCDIDLALAGRRPARLYVDWRIYTGMNSLISDGESRLRRMTRARWVTHVRPPRGASGMMVGKVVRRLGPTGSIYQCDDSHRSRLEREERKHKAIAESNPRLGSQQLQGQAGVVFVHGTRSCCVHSLADLQGKLTLPTHRFEHDTFLPVGENAGELTALIESSVQVERLLLFGHSRGGLIVRLVAAELREKGFGEPEVWTFGTPHEGTPLISRGLEILMRRLGGPARAMKLARMGLRSKVDVATDAHGVPREDAVGAVLSILLRDAALPAGLLIMAAKSPERDLLDKYAGLKTTYAFGGACTVDDVQGYAVCHAGFAHEMFEGASNDLVVGQASATAPAGGCALPDPCTHSAYFRDATVRRLIQQNC